MWRDDWEYGSRERPEDRYMRDPVFHQLVQLLGSFLEDNAMRQWTPTDLREAVMLAASDYEMRHVRPMYITKKEETK